MRDVLIEEVRGTHISIIGAFLIILGGFQLFFWVSILVLAPIFALACFIAWIGVILSVSYIVLGFGLLGRRIWAFTWTPALMIAMIALLAMILAFAGTTWLTMFLGPLIVIHAIILAIISWERGRYALRPLKPVRVQQPVVAERIEGLTCEECGSEDLRVYPDGSGICQNCKNVFSSIPKKP